MSSTGVTAPAGFSAAATTAGIKATGNPDMALVRNEGPRFDAAAVFTRNRVVAAPVTVSREAIQDGTLHAVVYNSGNANACNGRPGVDDARAIQAAAAERLGVAPSEVATCSTGLIGDRLPMNLMLPALERLADPAALGDHGADAATAILTTDTVKKETVVRRGGWSVGGMAKGVGMMAPSLATMLVCLTTDAAVSAEQLDAALRTASQRTFNVTGTDSDEEALEAARTIGRDNLFKCAMFGSDPNWGRVLAAVGMAKAAMDPENIGVWFNEHPVCLESMGAPGARDVDLSGVDIAVWVDLGTGGGGTATVYTTDLSYSYVEINSAYSS